MNQGGLTHCHQQDKFKSREFALTADEALPAGKASKRFF